MRKSDTYVVENNERLSPTTVVVTDSVENAVVPESGDQLLQEQDQQDTTDDSQDQVVDHEESVKLEGGEFLHDLTATENNHVVGNHHHRGLLKSGHGGHTLLELELAGRVSNDLFKGLIEDRP